MNGLTHTMPKNHNSRHYGFFRPHLPVLLCIFCFCAFAGSLSAKEILFIGNSFTYGFQEGVGGVPQLVKLIAQGKGQSCETTMLAVGGKGLRYHFRRPSTPNKPTAKELIASKKWDAIVLQDLSNIATHTGSSSRFQKYGEAFYRQIHEINPATIVVLYQTWAYGKNHPYMIGKTTNTGFTNPGEMFGEIVASFKVQEERLEEIDPDDQVLMARVGEAFRLSLEKYPDINLYLKDQLHASPEGLYLASLVLYSTIFADSPIGAKSEFPKLSIPPDVAEKLQQVAAQVCGHSASASVGRSVLRSLAAATPARPILL